VEECQRVFEHRSTCLQILAARHTDPRSGMLGGRPFPLGVLVYSLIARCHDVDEPHSARKIRVYPTDKRVCNS
jgi:hypothetical protein